MLTATLDKLSTTSLHSTTSLLHYSLIHSILLASHSLSLPLTGTARHVRHHLAPSLSALVGPQPILCSLSAAGSHDTHTWVPVHRDIRRSCSKHLLHRRALRDWEHFCSGLTYVRRPVRSFGHRTSAVQRLICLGLLLRTPWRCRLLNC